MIPASGPSPYVEKESDKNLYTQELKELIKDVRVQMIGPIRQELLSGVKSEKQFELLKKHLATFPDLQIETVDYEKAAEFFNISRGKGIQGSNTDFLICALSYRHKMPIFTIDKDFELYRVNIPIKFYNPKSILNN